MTGTSVAQNLLIEKEAAFLRSVDAKTPPAIVLGIGDATMLAFVRSLGRRGIPCVGVGPAGPSSRSRYGVHLRASRADLPLLKRIGERLPCRAVLCPVAEEEVLLVSEHRSVLEAFYDFVVADHATLRQIVDKRSQYEYAAGIGILTPRTFRADCVDSTPFVTPAIQYPCVIKPAQSHLYRGSEVARRWPKAAQADTEDELQTTLNAMAASGVELLIQERVEGPESNIYSLFAYLDRDSRPLATAIIRKRRQWPPAYGSGSYSVSSEQSEVTTLGLDLMQSMGYQGLANIEFKLDARDGRFKLIEFNPRGGLPMELTAAAGVDLPYIAYMDALGKPVAPALDYKLGVTWIDSLSDLASLRSYRTEGLSFLIWLRQALTANSRAYFVPRDPLPFFAHAFTTIGSASRKRFNKWRPGFLP